MQTLSEAYKTLITDYHVQSARWGSSSHRHAGEIAELAEIGESILDYGCGKGTLKVALEGYDVREFDPGIPGKDADPEPADIVVCTDVLEHIEPEFIDKVISHIYALAKRKAYLIIATRPAHAVLPDGRNAHLIIEDAAWWKAKLDKFFSFDATESSADEIKIIATPIRELKDIPAKGAIDDEIRGQQMASAMGRGLPRVTVADETGPAMLLCYGPSLNDQLPLIKALHSAGVKMITVSGAHDWALKNGMVPYAHVDIDGRPHKSGLIETPHPGVKYWMASVCHPNYFDKLEGFDVSTFHIMNTDETVEWVRKYDPGSWLLTGGLTVGNRTLGLMHHKGFKPIHVFGMDCSYKDGERHAGRHTGKVQQKMEVRCGDRWFTSSPQMICAARDIIASLGQMNAISEVTFYGDGLLQAMIEEATKDIRVAA